MLPSPSSEGNVCSRSGVGQILPGGPSRLTPEHHRQKLCRCHWTVYFCNVARAQSDGNGQRIGGNSRVHAPSLDRSRPCAQRKTGQSCSIPRFLNQASTNRSICKTRILTMRWSTQPWIMGNVRRETQRVESSFAITHPKIVDTSRSPLLTVV